MIQAQPFLSASLVSLLNLERKKKMKETGKNWSYLGAKKNQARITDI